MYDLIVIGGGPAGSAAAITAARSGARVLLLEKGSFPRQKVCGEFVSPESLELLERLLFVQQASLQRDATRISQARLFLDGRVLSAPIDPPASSIARLELDSGLWASAIECGAEAHSQTRVKEVCGDGPFTVSTSAGAFQGRAVIDASGRWSNLNAVSENGTDREKWLGLKAHFHESSPPPSVDLYFFEGGYCGIQPVTLRDSAVSRINVCAMVQAKQATTLKQAFALHPRLRERSGHWQPLGDEVSTSPLLFRDPQTERDGVLLAGDAAGFVDPFVGDGISLALRSGALAAECLVPLFAGRTTLHEAARHYREKYEEQLMHVFRSSAGLRQMLRLPRSVRGPLLRVLEKTPTVTRYLVKKTR